MVLESESSQQTGKVSCQTWDNTSRKSGFQAMQSKGQSSQSQDTKKTSNPWGPVFKDKKNFANMHHC